MVDREKVITGVDICLSRFHCGEDCPYYNAENRSGCMELLRKDALELLKEQEPIQMKVLEDYGSIKFGYCPKCNSLINNRSCPKSCGCGQAVKWDD